MKSSTVITAALCAGLALLPSCTKRTSALSLQEPAGVPIVLGIPEDKSVTWTTLTDLHEDGIGVRAYNASTRSIVIDCIPASYDASSGTYPIPGAYWPDEEVNFDFLSFHPSQAGICDWGMNANRPYFSFENWYTSDRYLHYDPVVAYAPGRNMGNSQAGVPLTFIHPFAALAKFKFCLASNGSDFYVKMDRITLYADGDDCTYCPATAGLPAQYTVPEDPQEIALLSSPSAAITGTSGIEMGLNCVLIPNIGGTFVYYVTFEWSYYRNDGDPFGSETQTLALSLPAGMKSAVTVNFPEFDSGRIYLDIVPYYEVDLGDMSI